MSLYTDKSRTLTLQTTGIITRQSSRSPAFRQSSNVLLEPEVPFTDQNFTVLAGTEHVIGSVNNFLLLSCTFNIELVIRKDGGTEVALDVKQSFNTTASIEGTVVLRNQDNYDKPVHLIFA